MELMPFLRWCQNTGIGQGISQSQWLFPVIESVHLLGLAAMGGAVLLVDLRLLGLGLRHQPARQLARDAQPLLLVSLSIMLVTGILLFMSEATKFDGLTNSAGFPFLVKMVCMVLGILFTFTIRRWLLNADESRLSPVWGPLVGLTSISLWTIVGVGGRAIGFY